MKILLKKIKVIDPNSNFNQKTVDILIEDSVIKEIGSALSDIGDGDSIEEENLHICPGLIDFRCHLGEPQDEILENVESLLDAAKAGGYTEVIVHPGKTNSINSKADVMFLQQRAKGKDVKMHLMANLTTDKTGKEMSEMYDLKSHGVVGFSDGKHPIKNAKLLLLSQLYAKGFNGLTCSFPYDANLATNGQMHEGIASTHLGLAGIPDISESIMVSRDVALTEYNETRLHVGPISSKESIDIIKKSNACVSTEVTVHNLIFKDEECNTFDSNFKMLPPLRTPEDKKSIVTGIKDDIIQIISSDHTPVDVEDKLKEFQNADFGAISLQTAFSAVLTAVGDEIELEKIVQCMSINPRKIVGIEVPKIEEGNKINATLFSPDESFTFTKSLNKSRAENSPYFGKELKGRIKGILV